MGGYVVSRWKKSQQAKWSFMSVAHIVRITKRFSAYNSRHCCSSLTQLMQNTDECAHVRVFDYCMCVQGNCISRTFMKEWWADRNVAHDDEDDGASCIQHTLSLSPPSHHPSCFLCDLYQMPDTGCLLISTMWCSYWLLRHNCSIS